MLTSLALTLWPAEVVDHCLPNETTSIVGIAYNTKNQLLYCEQVSNITEKQLHIDYLKDKKIFATKDLITVSTPEKPEVVQKDFRTGEIRQAILSQDKIRLAYQENRKEKEETSTLNTADVHIIDAGFDEFIRNHWQHFSINENNHLSVKFASIAHLRSLGLRIHLENLNRCEANSLKQNSPSLQKSASENQTKLDRCFVVDIDNFLLRILLGKMQLMYDTQHRLKNYLGPVNITDEAGQTQNASIDYYYEADYLTQQK